MAVTSVSNLTNATSVVVGTVYTTASVTPTSNALLLLAVYSYGSAATPAAPTVTGNGLTWVQIASTIVDSLTNKWQRITWFRALGAAPSAGVITITHGTSCQACQWSVDQFVGVDTSGTSGSGAIAQFLTGSGTGTNAIQAMAAFSDPDNTLYGSIGHGVQEGANPGSGFSELSDRNNTKTADPGALETQWGYGFSSISFGWATSSKYAYIAIEVASTPGQGYAAGGPTDWPVAILELDLNDQSNPSRNFVDISNRLTSGSYKHLRSFELDRMEAGDATFTCRNGDRFLDPEFAAGPWFGKLDSDRFLRFRILWKGQWKNEFIGYLQGIKQDRQGFSDQRAVLTCKNGFDPLSMETLSPSQYTLTTSTGVANGDLTYAARGAQTGGFGSAPGIQVGHLFGGFGSLQGNYSGGGPGITIAYTSGGTNPPITSDDVGVDEATGAIHIQLQQATGQAQNIMNAINAHAVASRLVYVSLAPGSNGSGQVGPMSATPLAGGFPAEGSGARINRCLNMISPIWPVGDRIIDTGTETIQQTAFEKKDNISALTHIQDVCQTELGVAFMDGQNRIVFHGRTHRVGAAVAYTFSDTPTAGQYAYADIDPIYDNEKVWNQWTVSQNSSGSSQTVEVTVNDVTSQGKHRIRNQTHSVICAAIAAVTTIANKLLARYKNQIVRYGNMTVTPTQGDAAFDILFDIDVSTCITVKRSPVAGGGVSSPQISSNHFVEGHDISFDDSRNWKFVFPLSPYATSQ